MIFDSFASSTAMGPTMVQIELFLIIFVRVYGSGRKMRRNLLYVRRRAFETAWFDFPNIARTKTIAYIIT